MALSLKELINNIPREPDVKNSRYVRIFKAQKKSEHEFWYQTVTNIPGEKARKHKQWVKDLSQQGLNQSKEIWVSCDCQRFKYFWEYALWKRGASMIRFCNGEPPVEKNPRMWPACCKHLYVVLSDILRKKGKYK
jgi:hypothetical protein